MSGRGIQTPRRLFIRGSLLSLGLLVFLTCETRIAQATCGDYLHGHKPAVTVNPILSLASPDLIIARPESRPEPSPTPICTGPHCQRDQQAPATPSKAIQIPTFTDAILATIEPCMSVEIAGVARPTNIDRLTGPVGRIFRPPRAA